MWKGELHVFPEHGDSKGLYLCIHVFSPYWTIIIIHPGEQGCQDTGYQELTQIGKQRHKLSAYVNQFQPGSKRRKCSPDKVVAWNCGTFMTNLHFLLKGDLDISHERAGGTTVKQKAILVYSLPKSYITGSSQASVSVHFFVAVARVAWTPVMCLTWDWCVQCRHHPPWQQWGQMLARWDTPRDTDPPVPNLLRLCFHRQN